MRLWRIDCDKKWSEVGHLTSTYIELLKCQREQENIYQQDMQMKELSKWSQESGGGQRDATRAKKRSNVCNAHYNLYNTIKKLFLLFDLTNAHNMAQNIFFTSFFLPNFPFRKASFTTWSFRIYSIRIICLNCWDKNYLNLRSTKKVIFFAKRFNFNLLIPCCNDLIDSIFSH